MRIEKDIKLIALDMDGTLLNTEEKVSEENYKAIQEAKNKGIHVVLSTGRSLDRCREIAESLGRSSYIVTINGGEIYNDRFELVDQTLLDSKLVERLWELRKQHEVHYWSTTVQGQFNSTQNFDKEVRDYDWLKFGFDIEDDEIRKVILDELNSNEALEISNSSPTNIEVNPAGVNKAAALLKVSERLNFNLDNVMAVGDSLNDLAMIKEAGIGVAMGNAQEDVKKAAAWVTDTNNDNGVAKAIRSVL
ncbi:Cof-type HAD-IIB family hydrolase [Halobacillus sp. A5]|uniref:Cof-type HAD-IIB family hydrolase n=1 Tax=Halobacillus sp. A5 TaxID=2880263 RepID=UPI0020A686A9|nr:Cof-type HAD-IIB family hydrolase [Halobacillus sp. A5]MCP3027300.1 Cof-type HAD-IIB family hydrolase [Halobacillus sp. A5]